MQVVKMTQTMAAAASRHASASGLRGISLENSPNSVSLFWLGADRAFGAARFDEVAAVMLPGEEGFPSKASRNLLRLAAVMLPGDAARRRTFPFQGFTQPLTTTRSEDV